MPVTSSNVNYATPTYSNIVLESFVDNTKYFSLHDNILDGTYHPLDSSGPLWGSALSNASGILSTPLVITVTDTTTVHALRLRGDSACNVIPVEFTITLYNGASNLFSQTFTNGSLLVDWVYYLSQVYNVTSYVVSIAKINKTNTVARVVSAFNPHVLSRLDNLVVKTTEVSTVSPLLYFSGVDSLVVKTTEVRALTNNVSVVDSPKVIITESRGFTNRVGAVDNLRTILSEQATTVNTMLLSDEASVVITDDDSITNTARGTDTLLVQSTSASDFSSLTQSYDDLNIETACEATPTNVHTRMKDIARSVYGKVRVTYMNPLLDSNMSTVSNGAAHNGSEAQVLNNVDDCDKVFFTLFDNVLDGSYVLLDEKATGWWSTELSQVYCGFDTDPELTVTFTPRLLQSLTIRSSKVMDVILVDFTINVLSNGTTQTYNIIGNDSYEYTLDSGPLPELSQIQIVVHTINKQFAPANIMELTLSSIVSYTEADLINIDFLEEISYDDDFESLGGVSSNSITVSLRNDDGQFYFNNPNSLVAKQLKKNRKIEAFLGTEIIEGEIEWYQLGTFWSHSWDVPVGSLYAKVVAFDTLGLLNTFMYENRVVFINKTIGYAIDAILTDAKDTQYPTLVWDVDPVLYTVVIPYIWFDAGTYMQTLNKLSMCYRLNIYCDRQGTVLARVRKPVASLYDTWSDSTNVIAKTYPTLHTDIPNSVEVVTSKVVITNDKVIDATSLSIDVTVLPSITFKAQKVITDNVVVTVTKSATVDYTFVVYSWGISFNFSGTGIVTAILVMADTLSVSEDISITVSNDIDVALNGKQTKVIKSDFIQTIAHASNLASDILSDIELDRYDVDVDYIGDIALTIDDPIRLENGIAPVDTYRLKRNTLYWDGSLSGTAKLNT